MPFHKGIFLLLGLCLSLPALAGEWYVCPWCGITSIQAAIDAASPGDVIYVLEGTYRESLIITKSISLIGVGRVVIEGARPGWPVIGIWTTSPGDVLGMVLGMDRPIEVTLEGLIIRGGPWVSDEVQCADYNANICPDGVAVKGRAKVTLRRLSIHDAGDDGISLGLNPEATIERCYIEGNYDDGIHAWLGARVHIEHCLIEVNGQSGIKLQSEYQLTDWLSLSVPVRAWIVGNVIQANGAYGIEAQTGEEIKACYGNTIRYNLEGPTNWGG